MKKITTTLLLALPLAAAAQVYKSHDEKGNPVFSDTPNNGGQVIDVPTPNTVPGVQPRQEKAQAKADPNQAQDYRTLSITSPANGGIIRNGLAPFTVAIAVEPQLNPRHQIRLTIDGETHGTSPNPELVVERIGRGSHQLQASIIDDNGKVLKTSPSIRVFAYWPGGR